MHLVLPLALCFGLSWGPPPNASPAKPVLKPQPAVRKAAAPKRADPTLEAPASAKVYVPVVVKLKDAFATTQVKWRLVPEPAWSEKLTTGVGFRFTGPPAKYVIKVEYVDFKKELWGDAAAEVVIEGSAPPPPPIDPPAPDEDFARLQTAYLSDSPVDPLQRKTAALALVRYYYEAATACRKSQAATAGALYGEISAVPIPPTASLPAVRAIVAPDLRKIIPTPTPSDYVITAAHRTSMAAVFEKYARLLEAVSK
jgi:hypothetical protein